ncbi:AAA family ATPase [Pseudonocardia xinjiangensis]|uniref:ATP-binding protein n=1 Tax=Pseudonocardia xinjiangensis TaxID=75289 RepID=A0ABX1RQM2_9PSEU|nr:AAA family ATPase [Pseudonocardia xinjiangensis]NMH81944.1 ATP-binding protein [Pseudonocardia xinjiangensis]
MIVWVNGAFGSGKTTLVRELHRQWPATLVFDPEQVGYVLREIVDVPTGNFQDLPLWRRQVAAMAVGLLEEYHRPLLVPMTLVEAAYLDEIIAAVGGITVRHFYLDVPRDVLVQRIESRTMTPDDPGRDADVRAWCVAQIERCRATTDRLPTGTVFLDGRQRVPELTATVLEHLGRAPSVRR